MRATVLLSLAAAGCSSVGGDVASGGGGAATTSSSNASGSVGSAQGSGGGGSGAGGQAAQSSAQSGAGGSTLPVDASAGCGIAQDAGFHCFDSTFEGEARNWCIQIPASYDPSHPHELVIGLHGCGGNNANVHNHRAPMEAAGEGEFLFVYPQAKDSCWDYTTVPSTGNDVAFIAHMIDEAQAMTCLDLDRTFVHGMSSGGSMASRVVRAGLAVAFASASSGGSTTEPAGAWYYGGTADAFYGTITSSLNAQLALNGCASTTTAIADSPCVRYDGCSDHPVVYCEDDRGHVWPNEAWAQGGILDHFRSIP